jgi:orotidine-5'-phosphate decarboxylase
MSKIIVALDCINPLDALGIVSKLRGKVDGFKINHMLWDEIGYLKDCGELFVDCKLWDTPNTVKQVLEKIVDKGATMTTISTFNNDAVFEECSKFADKIKLLGVTYLTSWSSDDQFRLYNKSVKDMWSENINRARGCLSGIICSPFDIETINEPDLLKVCPGIGAHVGQTRTAHPKKAKELGADYLVVGRTITTSNDPIREVDILNWFMNGND